MKKYLFILLLAGFCPPLFSFSPANPDSMLNKKNCSFYCMLPLVNEWSATINPAGISFYQMGEISQVSAGIDYSRDHIHMAELPGISGNLNVDARGMKRLGKFMFTGDFNYRNSRYFDLIYNSTSEFDMDKIYTYGDTVSGEQIKESFYMSGKVAYAISDRLIAGLNLDYTTAVGGKTRDPRNINDITYLYITPGLIYQIDRFSFGLSGGMFWKYNELALKIYHEEDYNLFEFMGLGYFEWDLISSSTSRMFYTKGYQAEAQVSYSRPGMKTLHSFQYLLSSLEIRQGSYYKYLDGLTDKGRLVYNGSLILTGEKYIHQLNALFFSETLKGTEIEQESVTISEYGGAYSWDSIYTVSRVENKHIIHDYKGGLTYRFYRTGHSRPFAYCLTAGTDFRYYSSYHYPVETNGFMEALTLAGNLEYTHFLHFSSFNLDPSLKIGLRKTLSSDLQYETENRILPDYPETDYLCLSSEYYLGQASLRFSKPLSKGVLKEWYTECEGRYYSYPGLETEDNFNFFVRFSLGIIY